MRARVVLGVVATLVACLLLEAVPAAAQDALICRKRDSMGDRTGKTYRLGPGNDYFNAGPGPDRVLGGPGNDVINGGRGNDVIRGGPGKDVVCGGTGRDRPSGEGGADEVYGEEGDDRVVGGPGKDFLNGQAGKDTLVGFGKRKGKFISDGRDYLEGSYRPDVLLFGGPDVGFGGEGNDRLTVKTPNAGARRMDGGLDTNVIEGNDAGDVIVGERGTSIVHAGGGPDRVQTGNAKDVIYGGDGDDRLGGGRGSDVIFGDGGFDFCSGSGIATFDLTCERTALDDDDKDDGPAPGFPAAPFTGTPPLASAAGACKPRVPKPMGALWPTSCSQPHARSFLVGGEAGRFPMGRSQR